MKDFVADTHALLWSLTADQKLSDAAKAVFDEALRGLAFIHIPSIVMAESYFANEKYKLGLDIREVFDQLDAAGQFVMTPFDVDDVLDFEKDSAIAEMHDRIIAGVSRRLNAPLITKDRNITASGLVDVIW